jgi:hypothetical protein
MEYRFVCTSEDGKKFNDPYECACYEYKNCVDWNKINNLMIRILIVKNNSIKESFQLKYEPNLGNPTFYECIKYNLNSRENAYLYIPNEESLKLIVKYLGYDPYADFDSLQIGLNKFKFVQNVNVPINPHTAQPYVEHFINFQKH